MLSPETRVTPASMLFNSFPFLLGFLPVALAPHAFIALHRPGWRLPLLVALSLVFYGWWDPRFVPLLVASIGLNWLVARWFGRSRAALLIPLAIAANLAVLALFKYAGFLAGLASVLPGLHDLPRPSLALPLGISFFTFQSLSYTIDFYRGRMHREGSFLRFATFVCFFPQLLAGPIERAAIPTEGINRLDARDVNYAAQLGYVVKLVATAQSLGTDADGTVQLDVRVNPTLLPKDHPLAGVHGVNNAILVEGDPVGRVMFYGPGAGAGPTASAVVADILNIAGIREVGGASGPLDPLLAASRWRQCQLLDGGQSQHRN